MDMDMDMVFIFSSQNPYENTFLECRLFGTFFWWKKADTLNSLKPPIMYEIYEIEIIIYLHFPSLLTKSPSFGGSLPHLPIYIPIYVPMCWTKKTHTHINTYLGLTWVGKVDCLHSSLSCVVVLVASACRFSSSIWAMNFRSRFASNLRRSRCVSFTFCCSCLLLLLADCNWLRW